MLEQSPLARQLALISATLQAEADRLALERTLLAALHLLIHACLLRIVARLASLIALWQADQLPHAPIRRRTTRQGRARSRANRQRQRRPPFSEEKEAKRLAIPLRRVSRPDSAPRKDESFLVLFFKKEPLPAYFCLPRFPPRPKFAQTAQPSTHRHFIPL